MVLDVWEVYQNHEYDIPFSLNQLSYLLFLFFENVNRFAKKSLQKKKLIKQKCRIPFLPDFVTAHHYAPHYWDTSKGKNDIRNMKVITSCRHEILRNGNKEVFLWAQSLTYWRSWHKILFHFVILWLLRRLVPVLWYFGTILRSAFIGTIILRNFLDFSSVKVFGNGELNRFNNFRFYEDRFKV